MQIFQRQKALFLGKKSQPTTRKKKSFFFFGTLFTAVILLGLGVAVWPWVPELTWHATHSTQVLGTFNEQPSKAPQHQVEFDVVRGNYIIIPKIDVASPIYEGETDTTLRKGVWRIPHTSTPAFGSNTVLTAHRFQYTFGPQTFYHLDKLEKGDVVYVYWQGTEYTYTVESTFAVSDTEVEVEDSTNENILTLYTCELFDTSKRIGIVAHLTSTLGLVTDTPDSSIVETNEFL